MKSFNLNTADPAKIQQENSMSFLMLNEMLSNKKVKEVVKKVCDKIITNILAPIIVEINQSQIQSLSDTPMYVQNAVKMLAIQSIDDEIAFGSILRGYKKAEDITISLENIRIFFNTYDKVLKSVDDLDEIGDVLKLFKSIADLSFCYFEYFNDQHSPLFNQIKDMIWLTPEECDGRIFRSELTQPDCRAITYGIGTEFKLDLVSQDEKRGVNSGKAVFAGASMKTRLEIIMAQYDQAIDKIHQLKQTGNKDLADAEKVLKSATKKMQDYKIPLEVEQRKSIDFYTKQFTTTFEKLAKLPDSKNNLSMPIVANISRSVARTLISMQDLHAFDNEQKQFDFETAQIFANSLIIFYILEGHHSFTEIAEIYNRLLDYIALLQPKQLPPGCIPEKLSELQYMVAPERLEKILPYYAIGNYSTFFHPDYAKQVVKESSSPDLSIEAYSKYFK